MKNVYLVIGQLYGNLPTSLLERLTSQPVTLEEACKEMPSNFPLQTSDVLRGNVVNEHTVIFVWGKDGSLRRYSFTPIQNTEVVVEPAPVSEPDTYEGYW